MKHLKYHLYPLYPVLLFPFFLRPTFCPDHLTKLLLSKLPFFFSALLSPMFYFPSSYLTSSSSYNRLSLSLLWKTLTTCLRRYQTHFVVLFLLCAPSQPPSLIHPPVPSLFMLDPPLCPQSSSLSILTLSLSTLCLHSLPWHCQQIDGI